MAVARLNKTTLEEYLQENIFKPLGITSTTFRLEKRPDIKERLLKTVERQADGTLKEIPKPWPDYAEEDCCGAGIYSTVGDYLKVLGDLVKDQPTLLSKDIVEKEMFRPQLAAGSNAMKGIEAAAPMMATMTGTTETTGLNWGIGGIYTEEDVGAYPKASLGWGGLPNLVWVANRERGVAAFFATQVLPLGDSQAGELAVKVLGEAFRLASS